MAKGKFNLVFLGVLTLFLVLKTVNIVPKLSDENVYLYDAYLVANGFLPYRDFFLAHLPGQIYLLSFFIKIFGFNLFVLKSVPLVFSVGTAFLLYLITRKGSGEWGGVLAAGFYLFSLTVLATSDHGSGVHEATFFLVLGWYLMGREAISDKRQEDSCLLHASYYILPGLAFFLGLTMRVYILPAVVGLLISSFLLDWKLFRNFTVKYFVILFCSAMPYLVLNLLLIAKYGERFLTPVWKYHFLKTEGIDKGKVLGFFLTNEWLLLGLALIGLISLIRQIGLIKSTGSILTPYYILLPLAAQALFLLFFSDIYYLYLVTIIPFLAVLGAGIIRLIRPIGQIRLISFFVLATYAAINFSNYQTNHAPASVITELDRIVADVKGITNLDDRLFGAFSIAPLVALESGRGIVNNEVDTNSKRSLTGLLTREQATEEALQSKVFIQTATVDFADNKILSLDPSFVDMKRVAANCEQFRVYPVKDYERNAVLVWRCGK